MKGIEGHEKQERPKRRKGEREKKTEKHGIIRKKGEKAEAKMERDGKDIDAKAKEKEGRGEKR